MGWDKYWGTDKYFGEYPYIEDAVVNYLIHSNKKGVGLDVIGIDPIAHESLPIHKKLFKDNEIVVIENLMNLDLVGKDLFTFCALPLKHIDADGSPIRAIAILEQ
jgi:kynurenine formamidase